MSQSLSIGINYAIVALDCFMNLRNYDPLRAFSHSVRCQKIFKGSGWALAKGTLSFLSALMITSIR